MENKHLLRISAAICALSGAVILFTTIYPIVSYESNAARKYPTLINPLAEKKTLGSKNTTTQPEGVIDYTDPQNWFVGTDYRVGNSTNVSYYTISIPRLEIENATVEIGGGDLGKSLIQYPGTALPGKTGNSVIFGHSILPQFNNPRSYLAIFSLLPTLERGDDIEVRYDGVVYKYKVETMFEVIPTDLQVLEQQDESSYLTLVTCVPPGHPLKPKRLIVRARVVEDFSAGIPDENTRA